MLQPDPAKRITVEEILKLPFIVEMTQGHKNDDYDNEESKEPMIM